MSHPPEFDAKAEVLRGGKALLAEGRTQAEDVAQRIKLDMDAHHDFLQKHICFCFPDDFYAEPRQSPLDPERKLRIFSYVTCEYKRQVMRSYLKAVIARVKPDLPVEFLVEVPAKRGPARTHVFLFAQRLRSRIRY